MTSSLEPAKISVEVAYALPDKQQILVVEVPEGSTALQAAEASGIVNIFADIDLEKAKMGVFGKAVKPEEYKVQAGDRVEIYRPLIADPKASRKARAVKASAKKKCSV